MRYLLVLLGLLSCFFLWEAFRSDTNSSAAHSIVLRAERQFQQELRQDSLQSSRPSQQTKTISHLLPKHLMLQLRLRGVTEIPSGSNRGEFIDKWESEFHMKGVAWCAIFQSVMNRDGEALPRIWSADAKRFICRDYSYKISDVIYGRYLPKPGDYRVKGTPGKAHIDAVVSWDTAAQTGVLIGGNVSNSVKLRAVTLKSLIFDGTTHITAVAGRHEYVISAEAKAVEPKTGPATTMKATYYHDNFHGQRTASGEKFDNTKLTAAHKTLPFGTRVIVTNPKNNKSVTVKINDRIGTTGVIDLTQRAAKMIGISSGKVSVKIIKSNI